MFLYITCFPTKTSVFPSGTIQTVLFWPPLWNNLKLWEIMVDLVGERTTSKINVFSFAEKRTYIKKPKIESSGRLVCRRWECLVVTPRRNHYSAIHGVAVVYDELVRKRLAERAYQNGPLFDPDRGTYKVDEHLHKQTEKAEGERVYQRNGKPAKARGRLLQRRKLVCK